MGRTAAAAPEAAAGALAAPKAAADECDEGSDEFDDEELEDAATAQRSAVARVAGTALMLPLMVRAKQHRSTELLMRRQLVGWDDGGAAAAKSG